MPPPHPSGAPPWIRAIARDRVRGATALTERAARALLEALGGLQQDPGIQEELARLGRQLRLAQPAMGPLFHLANAALLGVSERRGAEGAKKSILSFLESLERAKAGLLRAALPLLPRRGCLLTHSASSAVEALLRRAKGVRVLCTESRPGGEGLRLSRRLARAGVPVRLVPDLAAFEALKEVDLFLVGGDALTPRGLVHKIGTAPLARWARGHGVPVVTLCTSQKFLPERILAPLWVPEGGRRGSPSALEGGWRGLFDRTPWRDLTCVVTEKGPMGRKKVLRAISSIEVSPAWEALLKGSGV